WPGRGRQGGWARVRGGPERRSGCKAWEDGAELTVNDDDWWEYAMDAQFTPPEPRNEPVLGYAPGSPERAALQARLTELAASPVDLTMTIDGERRAGGIRSRSYSRIVTPMFSA